MAGKRKPFILGGDLFFLLDFGLEEYCEPCMSGSSPTMGWFGLFGGSPVQIHYLASVAPW